MTDTTFVNLTPHALNVHRPDGTVLNIPPSGDVARVARDSVATRHAGDVPIDVTRSGAVTGLPDPVSGVFYVVSGMVASATPLRDDVVSPGPLVRDDDGRPIGCRGLAKSL